MSTDFVNGFNNFDRDYANQLGPVFNYILFFLVCLVLSKMVTVLGADLIEEMSNGVSLKENMRTGFKNAGIVSALLLSIDVNMMQINCPYGGNGQTISWQLYQGSCFMSAGLSLQSVVASSVGLMYTSGFSEYQNKVFLLKNPGQISYSIACMIVASILSIFQTTLYMTFSSGPYMFTFVPIAASLVVYNLYTSWLLCSAFKNSEISESHRENRKKLLTTVNWHGYKNAVQTNNLQETEGDLQKIEMMWKFD